MDKKLSVCSPNWQGHCFEGRPCWRLRPTTLNQRARWTAENLARIQKGSCVIHQVDVVDTRVTC